MNNCLVAVAAACKHEFFKEVLRCIPMAVNFTGKSINYVEKAEEKWPRENAPCYDSPIDSDPYDPHVLVRTDEYGHVIRVHQSHWVNKES
jgi:hypothetical protein